MSFQNTTSYRIYKNVILSCDYNSKHNLCNLKLWYSAENATSNRVFIWKCNFNSKTCFDVTVLAIFQKMILRLICLNIVTFWISKLICCKIIIISHIIYPTWTVKLALSHKIINYLHSCWNNNYSFFLPSHTNSGAHLGKEFTNFFSPQFFNPESVSAHTWRIPFRISPFVNIFSQGKNISYSIDGQAHQV